MKTVEIQATVSEDGTLTAKVPSEVTPGEHRAVILIDDNKKQSASEELQLGRYDISLMPSNMTFRREDLYDDRV